MKKRIISIMIVAAMLLGIMPTSVFAEDAATSGTCGENLTWVLDCDGVLTISGTGAMYDYVIGYEYAPWHENRANVTSVVIGVGVTSIGYAAFYFCSSLTNVTIPDSVTSIGDVAFKSCGRLTSVTIPNSVTFIGSQAFDNCQGLTDVTIGDNVTTIGSSAFYSCYNLTRVTIPSSVTFIGYHAFYNCRGLTDVTIGDSMTIRNGGCTIGGEAFSRCSNLTRVTIGNNVTTIGNEAFAFCSKLTRLSIGDNVTTIGDYAFYACDNLTSVTIPNNVTTIGCEVFGFCTKLSGVTIGDSVTTIARYMFYSCYDLTSVNIPNSVTIISDNAFNRCNLTDVYYGGSEKEWNKITIEDNNECLLNATIHYNSSGVIPQDADITVPSGKYCIYAVNSNGEPVPDATVSWNDTNSSTDASGKAYFDLLTAGEPVVTVSKDGYVTWTNANSDWTKSSDRFSKVILYTEAEGEYRLSTAQYSSSVAFSSPVDLLTRTKTLNLKNDGNLIGDLTNGEFYLSCTAGNPSGVDHYELWQASTQIENCTDGKFLQLSVKRFVKGGDCFIRVVTTDGEKVDTHINLEFVENSVNETTGFNLSTESLSIQVADDVPFVGGSELTCKLPFPNKWTTVVNEDKIQIGYNVKSVGGKSETEQMEEVKKYLSRLHNSPNVGFSKADRLKMKSFVQESNSAKFFKGGNLDVLGYVECDIGSHTGTGQIMAAFTIDAVKAEYNTIVWVIPVTVQFGVELGITGIGNIQYDWENATVTGGFDFEPSAELSAFGGIGASNLAGAGAYGSAKLDALARIIGTPSGWQKVDLTGELGIKAYLGYWEYKRAFAYNTWHLYTGNAVTKASILASGEAWNDGLNDISQYNPSDLSYLSNESAWQGENRVRMASAEASTDLKPLLEDTYRNAQPTMVAGSNELYAAFVRADADTGIRYLACTKFDGSSWQEPVQVNADALLDDAPTMCVDDNGTIWLAYARTTETGDDTLLTYAQNQEIVVGILNPDTLCFTEKVTYTGAGYVHMQQLAVINGQPVLAWIDGQLTDDENSILNPEIESINYAICSNGEWSNSNKLKDVTTGITDLTVGIDNGNYVVVYTSNQVLYGLAVDGDETILAENVTGRVRYGVLPCGESAAFIWNGENCLNDSAGKTITVEGITGEYAIIGNSVYYSMAIDNSANLMVKQYNPDTMTWSLPVQLTDEERYLENLSVAELNGNDYVLGMSTVASISEDAVEDTKNLVWSVVTPVNNLRLEEVEYDAEAAAGDDVTVTLTVTNAGTRTVNGFTVTVDDEEKAEVKDPLTPGDSTDVEISLSCPNGLTTYQLMVTNSSCEDYYPDDNTEEIKLGYADVAVAMEYHQIGTQKALLAVVTNEGVETASGGVVIYDANGKAVAESAFDSLESGATTVVQYELGQNFAGIQGGDVSAQVVVDQEELYTYNNSIVLHINEPVYQTMIQSVEKTGSIVETVVSCAKDVVATAYCASYDANGKMLKVDQQILAADSINQLSFLLDEGAQRVKIYVLGENSEPLCESVELN